MQGPLSPSDKEALAPRINSAVIIEQMSSSGNVADAMDFMGKATGGARRNRNRSRKQRRNTRKQRQNRRQRQSRRQRNRQ